MDMTPNEPEGKVPEAPPEQTSAEASPSGQGQEASPQVPPPVDAPATQAYERGEANLPKGGSEIFGSSYYPGSSQPPQGYSQYPRYLPWNKGPVPPAPPAVRFAAIGESLEFIKQDFGTYILATLVLAMIGAIVAGAIRIPVSIMIMMEPKTTDNPFLAGLPQSPQTWGLYIGSLILGNAIGSVAMAGMYPLCMKRLRGLPISIADAFEGFKRFFPLFGAMLIYSLLTLVGFALFIVPCILVWGAFAFVPVLIIDQKVGVGEAFSMSVQAMRKDALMMGLLVVVAGIVGSIGLVACCIGIIFTMPIYFMTIALHYHAYFPPQGGPEFVPTQVPAPQYSA